MFWIFIMKHTRGITCITFRVRQGKCYKLSDFGKSMLINMPCYLWWFPLSWYHYCHKLFTFSSTSQEMLSISTKLDKNLSWFLKDDNSKLPLKMHWQHDILFFSTAILSAGISFFFSQMIGSPLFQREMIVK